MLDLIKKHGGISSLISDWYKYKYDGGKQGTLIVDGGNDMLDVGNKVKCDKQSMILCRKIP